MGPVMGSATQNIAYRGSPRAHLGPPSAAEGVWQEREHRAGRRLQRRDAEEAEEAQLVDCHRGACGPGARLSSRPVRAVAHGGGSGPNVTAIIQPMQITARIGMRSDPNDPPRIIHMMSVIARTTHTMRCVVNSAPSIWSRGTPENARPVVVSRQLYR